jgi:hypothetical protein
VSGLTASQCWLPQTNRFWLQNVDYIIEAMTEAVYRSNNFRNPADVIEVLIDTYRFANV